MFKYLCKGISIIIALFSCCVVQAEEAVGCGKDGTAACEVRFSFAPAFANMCAGAVQTKVFIITNDAPVTVPLTSIKVLNSPSGTPNPYANVVPAPTNSCGPTLAPGASCNIQVNLTPPANVTTPFSLFVEVGIGSPSNQGTLKSPTFTLSAIEGCNVAFTTIPIFTDVCPSNLGGPNEQQTFTIKNSSASSVTLSIPQIVSLDSLDATVTVDGLSTCGVSLGAGASCNIIVDVNPGLETGAIDRLLELTVNGIALLATPINLNVLNTCKLTFSNPVPTAFNMQCGVDQKLSYIVKNNSPNPETISGLPTLQINGGNTVPGGTVTIFSNSCPNGGTLAAGAFCTIVVDMLIPCGATGDLEVNQTLLVPIPAGDITPAPTIIATIFPTVTPPPPIDYLGNAAACAVLAGTTVTNVPAVGTIVTNGDVCVSTGTAITGFGVGTGVITPPGIQQPNTSVAINAQAALTNAITTLAALPCVHSLTGQDLGSQPTLLAGVYCFNSSAQLTGTLKLSGSATDVFVFQIGTTLTTASFSQVQLLGSVNPNNIYWVVGSSATLGTGTQFEGNILATASITMNTNANLLNGRALASTGAVTLDNNAITAP